MRDILQEAKEWLAEPEPDNGEPEKLDVNETVLMIARLVTEVDKLRSALRPFANYACDPPCGCHNCKAKFVLDYPKKP